LRVLGDDVDVVASGLFLFLGWGAWDAIDVRRFSSAVRRDAGLRRLRRGRKVSSHRHWFLDFLVHGGQDRVNMYHCD
jgi:hypothetical protein